MTTDIYPVSGRSRTAGRSLIGRAIGKSKLGLGHFIHHPRRIRKDVKGLGRASGWKSVMDRIAFALMFVLALGLWVHPYVTYPSDPAANATQTHSALRPASANPHPDVVSAKTPTASPNTLATVRGNPGFWHLAQGSDGIWWFVSPKGEPQFLNTVTTVQPYQFGRDKNGIHFVSKDWNGSAGSEGDLDAWAKKTSARVIAMGFKGLGAWSHPIFHKFDIP